MDATIGGESRERLPRNYAGWPIWQWQRMRRMGETEMSDPETTRTPLQQATEATDLARAAFSAGDNVTGIAAITLAAQLLQLVRIWETIDANR